MIKGFGKRRKMFESRINLFSDLKVENKKKFSDNRRPRVMNASITRNDHLSRRENQPFLNSRYVVAQE